jgi:hypothetical protein
VQQEAWHFISFMAEANQQSIPSLDSAPVNYKGIEQNFTVYGLSEEEKEQAYKFMENIDYTYNIYAYRADISSPIMQYINDELTLDEALTLAEENVMFRLNE